jgi:putative transposase
MKKSRFNEEKIIALLKQAEAGVKVAELIRKHGSANRRFTTGRPSTAAWMSRSCGA